MVMPYHLHMPSYFLETFTEYPFIKTKEELPLRQSLFSEFESMLFNFDNLGCFFFVFRCTFRQLDS